VTPRVRQYVAEEASAAGIDAGDIFTRSKRRPVAYARRRVAVRLRTDGFSYQQIGRWLGLDHSTIVYYMGGALPPRVRA
jgi:DNA-binding NarL/FixJ family response regulator